jgi:hypothetical protein
MTVMRALAPFWLLLAATSTKLCLASFAPQWQVGDWWVTKSNHISGKVGWRLMYDYRRYDVIRIDSVGGHPCYVLQVEYRDYTTTPGNLRDAYYVRMDNWAVVRQIAYSRGNRGFEEMSHWDSPRGQVEYIEAGPSLPHFPLSGKPTSRRIPLPRRDGGTVPRYFRDSSATADSTVVTQWLDEDRDAPFVRVSRPSGVAYYLYHIESDANRATQRRSYSNQIWCKNQPWRLYELRQLDYSPFTITQKSWLIASGHAGK